MLRNICRAILFILGWKFPDIHKLKSEERIVLLFPHTSFWDGFLAILFRIAYLDDVNVRLLLFHTYYQDWNKKMCDKIGFIPVGKKEKCGTVDHISKTLNKLKKFVFIISPEGGFDKITDFKTGFYHIAKKTGAKIAVVNLDFQKHTMEYHGPWKVEDTPEKEVNRLKKYFSLCPPLYPENTDYAEHYFPIREQLHGCRWEQVIGFIIFLCILYNMVFG